MRLKSLLTAALDTCHKGTFSRIGSFFDLATTRARAMADDPNMLAAIKRLVEETGITEAQARTLIVMIGITNWSSLVREAKILKSRGW